MLVGTEVASGDGGLASGMEVARLLGRRSLPSGTPIAIAASNEMGREP